MNQPAIHAGVWKTSTHSGSGHGGNCVEVGVMDDSTVAVRDSKHRELGLLAADRREWTNWITAVKNL